MAPHDELVKKLMNRPGVAAEVARIEREEGEDIPMIRTLGKAFYWQKLLDQGDFATIRDLSRAMKLEHGWVAEILRMTTRAPDIIEAILDGQQPRHLNLQTLRGRHEPLPRDWQEQRTLFGFSV